MQIVWIFVLAFGGIAFAYVLLRTILPWVLNWLDRAPGRDPEILLLSDELPRYYTTRSNGQTDPCSRWPGWDGWHVYVLPQESSRVQMARGTVMTGLYGLEGIDNFEKLMWRLSTFQAIEQLCWLPTDSPERNGRSVVNNLSQQYLPKSTDLWMENERLDVTVFGSTVNRESQQEPYGRIRGTWPDYQFDFVNPQAEAKLSLRYRAEKVLWWTDLPRLYAHLATFGQYEGEIRYRRKQSLELSGGDSFPIQAPGTFEHVFSRKPFGFDRLWLPLRLLGRTFPSLKPLLYHYEVFFDEGELRGGFVHFRAFGIDLRRRGAFFHGGVRRSITTVQIRYTEPVETVDCSRIDAPVVFYRQWEVVAETPEGTLQYSARITHPPARVSSSFVCYHIRYEGKYCGQPIAGSGYGEYIRM